MVLNLWQDNMIYGLIDAHQAIRKLTKENTLLLRFSLRYQCLTFTYRDNRQNWKKVDAINDYVCDFKATEFKKYEEYDLLTANGDCKMEGLDGLYLSEAKTSQRLLDYKTWVQHEYAIIVPSDNNGDNESEPGAESGFLVWNSKAGITSSTDSENTPSISAQNRVVSVSES